MDEDEIKQEIANWKFNGERPSIKWRARLSQAVKAARIAAGVAWRIEDTQHFEQHLRDHALEVARAQSSASIPIPAGQVIAPPNADVLIHPGARIAKCCDCADSLRREVLKSLRLREA